MLSRTCDFSGKSTIFERGASQTKACRLPSAMSEASAGRDQESAAVSHVPVPYFG